MVKKWITCMLAPTLLLVFYGCGKKRHQQDETASPETPSHAATGTLTAPGGTVKGSGVTAQATDSLSLIAACAPVDRRMCQALSDAIAALKEERENARDAKNEAGFQLKNLELGHKTEILLLYARGQTPSGAELAAIDETYAGLTQKLQTQIALKLPMGLYSPGELAAVEEVFKAYGDLYITPSALDADGKPVPSVATISGRPPWSAYWYPKRDKSLFEDKDSPLAKFDQLVQKVDGTPSAVAFESARFDPNGAEWEGLCDAWSMASIRTAEPMDAITYKGISFSPTDLKALSVKLFEGNTAKIYGRRYYADSRSDGEFQDIRPEAFHRLVEKILQQDKQAIVLDTDPGPEVWTEPLMGMDWYITKDPKIQNAYLVKAWARFISYRTEKSDAPTSALDQQIRRYEYRLYVDPQKTNAQGGVKVMYGEWLGSSLDAHPDFIFIPSPNLTPSNKGIADNKNLLLDLLKEAKVMP